MGIPQIRIYSSLSIYNKRNSWLIRPSTEAYNPFIIYNYHVSLQYNSHPFIIIGQKILMRVNTLRKSSSPLLIKCGNDEQLRLAILHRLTFRKNPSGYLYDHFRLITSKMQTSDFITKDF